MELNIELKHLYFALEGIWFGLDYRFKYEVNQIISAVVAEEELNGTDLSETQVAIDIDAHTLSVIIDHINNQPQGVAREINPTMFLEILPQVQTAAQQGNTEAIEMLNLMFQAQTNNATLLEEKIQRGKQIILH